ncbi:MAG: DNA alkylation repair protein, partial [Balneolaceae bacterium]|nr:DNA alkylation repair protein [Balneolaceae bacterium]
QQMLNWSRHHHSHVRRLASEGCRPRLPWAMALPRFKKDPAPILPILENLKDDPSEFVRRSVANNLNDISKDHPKLVLEIGKRWIGADVNRDKIIKHACRTLLKSGDVRALELFGFLEPSDIEILHFECDSSVNMGKHLKFSFIVKNGGKKRSKVRIEYGIDYMKSNGSTNRKIFQISETVLKSGESKEFMRTQSFKKLTTRKHYPGRHALAILVNGRELVKSGFMVSE